MSLAVTVMSTFEHWDATPVARRLASGTTAALLLVLVLLAHRQRVIRQVSVIIVEKVVIIVVKCIKAGLRTRSACMAHRTTTGTTCCRGRGLTHHRAPRLLHRLPDLHHVLHRRLLEDTLSHITGLFLYAAIASGFARRSPAGLLALRVPRGVELSLAMVAVLHTHCHYDILILIFFSLLCTESRWPDTPTAVEVTNMFAIFPTKI
mmetsp:Transcript_10458/g.19417  ORF Transcript_10458/g.19417 Transcript_10458/m.19417 type:complete len:206 (-) Transcript_10458:45-662(-)